MATAVVFHAPKISIKIMAEYFGRGIPQRAVLYLPLSSCLVVVTAINNNLKVKGQCLGSTGQRFQVELTKTVTDGTQRTEKDTKYVTNHETACST